MCYHKSLFGERRDWRTVGPFSEQETEAAEWNSAIIILLTFSCFLYCDMSECIQGKRPVVDVVCCHKDELFDLLFGLSFVFVFFFGIFPTLCVGSVCHQIKE